MGNFKQVLYKLSLLAITVWIALPSSAEARRRLTTDEANSYLYEPEQNDLPDRFGKGLHQFFGGIGHAITGTRHYWYHGKCLAYEGSTGRTYHITDGDDINDFCGEAPLSDARSYRAACRIEYRRWMSSVYDPSIPQSVDEYCGRDSESVHRRRALLKRHGHHRPHRHHYSSGQSGRSRRDRGDSVQ